MGSSNHIERVAIIGASGHVGGYFLEELVKTGKHSITVLTRHDSTTTFPDRVTVARVDYPDPSTLVNALRGQQFIVITLSAQAPPGTHTTIVKAAIEAGVPYIMPNTYGGDFMNETLRSQDMVSAAAYKNALEIEELGASYTAMCCGFWYEWSLALGEPCFGFDIKNRKVTFFDEGKNKFNISTWKQCGLSFAALLSLPAKKDSSVTERPTLEDWKNKQFFVSSFCISQRDMLDSLHRVLGTKDEDWEITYEPFSKRIQDGKDEMGKGNMMGFPKVLYSTNFSIPGAMQFGDKVVNETLGLPEEDLDEATKRAVEMVESSWNPFTS